MPSMDHDQRFKTIIREFFADFLRLFFADWAERLDLSSVEWLDKELLPDPPDGSRHQLDLVARLRTREQVADAHPEEPERWLALVHIEIEAADRTTALKPRLPHYYVHLRHRYQLPVLPIVLYLKVGLEGIGTDTYEERFWELRALGFDYLYVGLPGLDAVQYIEGDNPLGLALAALMRIPPERVAWLGAEALRKLTEAPLNDQQRFLLGECVHAYLPMNEQQQQEYERLVTVEPYTKVNAMNKTYYEKGIDQGMEKGIEKGLQTALLRQGRKRFGAPTPETENRIRSIEDATRLEALVERIIDVTSWDELLADA
jgi:hypothetical protein